MNDTVISCAGSVDASPSQCFGSRLNTPRKDLRGTIEVIADRIDGIVSDGKSYTDRIRKVEGEAREQRVFDAPFSIGSGLVHGAVTEPNVIVASQFIINDLQKILTTD